MSERNGSAIEGLGLHKAYGGVLALEDELQKLRSQIGRLQRQLRDEVEQVHKQYRRDLVLYRDIHDDRPERRWTSTS